MLRLGSRRLLVFCAILALSSGAAFAALIDQGACTQFTTVSALTTNVSNASPGNFCTVGNMEFRNFTTSFSGASAIPGSWMVSFEQTGNTFELTLTENSGDQLNGGASGAITYALAYDIKLIAPPGNDIGGGWLTGTVGTNGHFGSPYNSNLARLGENPGHQLGLQIIGTGGPAYGSQVNFLYPDGVTTASIRTDVTVYKNDYASGITLTEAFTESTPEPASVALLGLGLATLAFLKRRRARN